MPPAASFGQRRIGALLVVLVALVGCLDNNGRRARGREAGIDAAVMAVDAGRQPLLDVAGLDGLAPVGEVGDADSVDLLVDSDASLADGARSDASDTARPDVPDANAKPDAARDGAEGPVLALTNLTFDLLPVDSIRGWVRGSDPVTGLCAHVVWDYSNTNRLRRRRCDDFGPRFPYVFLSAGACTGVPHSGNVKVVSSRGCIDFAAFGPPSTNHADVTLEVAGPLFTGTIELHGP